MYSLVRCGALPAPIVGDCSYCHGRSCGAHRLTEAHCCAAMAALRRSQKKVHRGFGNRTTNARPPSDPQTLEIFMRTYENRLAAPGAPRSRLCGAQRRKPTRGRGVRACVCTRARTHARGACEVPAAQPSDSDATSKPPLTNLRHARARERANSRAQEEADSQPKTSGTGSNDSESNRPAPASTSATGSTRTARPRLRPPTTWTARGKDGPRPAPGQTGPI